MTISEQIAALEKATTDELIAQYTELHGKGPRTRNRTWLQRRLAWKIQEQAFGGLSAPARAKLEDLIGRIDGPLGTGSPTVTRKMQPVRKPGTPSVGTTLVRVWRGTEYRVQVRDNGYELDGVLHRSMSAAAKAITGTHWNGKLFFGLTSRAKKS